jgi:ribosome-associated translation inhibitor RaiA
MFKYLSEILSKFTPQQRILALGLLLFTIVTLTLGNKVIDTLNQSDKVLQDKVRRLELSQSILISENDSLYNSLSSSQIQCSNDIMGVRRKILEDLGILETQMLSQQRRVSYKVQSQPTQYIDNHNDTVEVLMMSSQQPIQIEDNSEVMVTAIRNLKEKIKKDIK